MEIVAERRTRQMNVIGSATDRNRLATQRDTLRTNSTVHIAF